jgi:molybdate transport system permease protein
MNMDWSPLWISINTAIPATVLTFFLGIFFARKATETEERLARILDLLFTLPLVLPPTVVGFLLLALLGRNGVMGRGLATIGIQIVFTRAAAILTATVIALPLMYRSAKAALEQVDKNLIYAGRSLGMSEGKIFWRVCMPNAFPGIASGTILAFARALGEFGATLMLAGNIPGRTQTMPTAIYTAIQSGRERDAIVWVLVLLFFSCLMILLMGALSVDRQRGRRKRDGAIR